MHLSISIPGYFFKYLCPALLQTIICLLWHIFRHLKRPFFRYHNAFVSFHPELDKVFQLISNSQANSGFNMCSNSARGPEQRRTHAERQTNPLTYYSSAFISYACWTASASCIGTGAIARLYSPYLPELGTRCCWETAMRCTPEGNNVPRGLSSGV